MWQALGECVPSYHIMDTAALPVFMEAAAVPEVVNGQRLVEGPMAVIDGVVTSILLRVRDGRKNQETGRWDEQETWLI